MSNQMRQCKYYDICRLTDEADPGAGLCILHSHSTKKNAEVFNQAFARHREQNGRNFSHMVFPGDVDFQGTPFTREVSFHNVKFTAQVNFAKATFAEAVDFTDAISAEVADFGNTAFSKRADFREARFEGSASFLSIIFSGDADFYAVEFLGEVLFDHATFSQTAIFSFAKFTQQADFVGANFAQNATFEGAKFAGRVDFDLASFMANSSFRWAEFLSTATFQMTLFKGTSADFMSSSFRDRAVFAARVNEGGKVHIFSGVDVDFSFVIVDPPDVLSFIEADMRRCELMYTDLRKIQLAGVIWPRIPHRLVTYIPRIRGRIGVYDEIFHSRSEPDYPWDLIERLYRELKQNYEDRRDYERAGDFHYGEKEMRRSNPATPLGLRFWLTLYRFAGGYGERYLPPLIWSAVLLVLSAIGYIAFGLRLKSEQGGAFLALTSIWDWLLTFNYSLRVMTFLRPDDLVPVGCAKLINTVQSLFGPVFLGLFGLALRQRLKR